MKLVISKRDLDSRLRAAAKDRDNNALNIRYIETRPVLVIDLNHYQEVIPIEVEDAPTG